MSDLLSHFTAWRDTANKDLVSPHRQPAPSAGGAPESFETALNAANVTPEGEPFSGWDVLDIINPLQHIPLVSDAYRAMTGDTIRPEIQLAGSTAVGGVLGFATQLGKMVFEAGTGQTMGDAVVTALTGNSTTEQSPTPPQQTAALPPEIIVQDLAPITQGSNHYPSVSQAFAARAAHQAYQQSDKNDDAGSVARHIL